MEVWHILTPILLILTLFLLSKVLRSLRKLYVQFRDYYILWNVAFGAHSDRRNISQRLRLHAYVSETVLLDSVSINELYSFGKSMVDTEVSVAQFREVALSYKYVISCREKTDGSLRGIVFFDKSTQDISGQKCILIKMGLAFFNHSYQGGPLLYFVICYHIIKEMISHPLTPIFVVSKLFSYKSYIGFIQAVTNVYPRYDAPTIPELERKVLSHFADSVRKPNEEYDPVNFILKREASKVKEFVAPITERDMKNPHIKFFTERNPDWQKGHCMFCVAPLTKLDLIQVVLKAIKRSLSIDRKPSTQKYKKLRKSYDRMISYQTADAVNEVLEHYDLDDEGHAVPVFEPSKDIYVSPDDEDDKDL